MKRILKDKLFLFFLCSGLFLRLVLAFIPGFKIDVDAWFAWAERLSSGGFINFYSDQIWTNYTPGYLYILKFLGDIKNIFSIDTATFYFILKTPAIVADLLVSILIYKIIVKSQSIKTARLVSAAILFNLALIFDSAIWGQIDSILCFFLIASVYCLDNKKNTFSSILFAIAFLIKPQAVSIFPVFLFFLIKNFSVKKLLQLIFPGFLIVLLFSLPFFGLQVLQKLPELLLKMTADYPYTSLFAYNLWGIVGFWVKDNTFFLFTSYQYLGYILYFTFWLLVAILHFRSKPFSLYSIASMACLSFYFLPTRAHDRYLYPAIPFLIIVSTQLRSHILSLLTHLLSITYLLNLYYVYIYYNYGYLKLPSEIYSPFLYPFLESNGKILSVLSTFIFILVNIFIIRLNYVKKNLPA